jgi:proteasome lid subunit RPN8/RPN11
MRVKFPLKLLKNVRELAKNNHPNEIILLLRGKKESEDIIVENLLVPPMGVGGRGFANFPPHMLPIDFSIIGTIHSHPSGRLTPSTRDLHSMYGRVMLIIGFPYKCSSISAFTKNGEQIPVKIT